MHKVESFDQIQQFIGRIRQLGKGFATNFFWDPDRHPYWIKDGSLFYEEGKDSVLLFHPGDGFLNLYYISTGLDNALSSLTDSHFSEPLVLDFICKGEMPETVARSFENAGFRVYRQLFRMTHAGAMECRPGDGADMVWGTQDDIQGLQRVFQRDFDALCEQIPTSDELQDFIDRKQVLVSRDDGELAGFLIYEMNGLTWYLRYWYTSPDHRDKGIGSKLLRQSLKLGEGSKRQILWVLADNQNAIKRYGYYGFTRENMNDFVMIKKNVS